MILNKFKKTAKINVGLDISSEGLTLVCLSKENNGYCLKDYYEMSFQEELLQNGIISKPDVFIENLKKMLEENHQDIKTVNICVSSNNTFIKTVSFPNIPAEELKIIAPQEASKHIPFTINEINVDFQIIENSAKDNKIDVILCALAKSIARNLVETISKAGIETVSIDVSSFAMMRTLANTKIINNPEAAYISVLIEHESTDISVIKNGMPVFSHNTQTGKKTIIDALVKGLELKREEVKKRLPEFGLILPGMDASSSPDANKASNITRNIYSGISSEIQKTIEFYNSQNVENTEIEKIILGGSGICIQNIDKYISNKLQIPAELCDSLKNISHKLEISDNMIHPLNVPALCTSIGLALPHS